MANLANALKEEIARIVRKEVREQTAEAIKATAGQQREVTALKRQIQALERTVSSVRGQEAYKPAESGKKKTDKKKAGKETEQSKKAAKTESTAAAAPRKPRVRFSGKALKAHRERLGLSADNYGKLIGVSGLSIYSWESEKAHPREGSVAKLTKIRGIGKREAVKRLEALQNGKPRNEKG